MRSSKRSVAAQAGVAADQGPILDEIKLAARQQAMFDASPYGKALLARRACPGLEASSIAQQRTLRKASDLLSTASLAAVDIADVVCLSAMFDTCFQQGISIDLAKGRVLALLFCEPSTRTSCSFQAAMLRLGGGVITVADVATSSMAKGETLEDTARTLAAYADVLVVRHPRTGSAADVAACLAGQVPVVNAGDGAGEHPSQALLDMATIVNETGRMHNLNILVAGDLKYGRTVHSLIPVLGRFPGNVVRCVASPHFAMPARVLAALATTTPVGGVGGPAGGAAKAEEAAGAAAASSSGSSGAAAAAGEGGAAARPSFAALPVEATDILPYLPLADVLYLTRLQKERLPGGKGCESGAGAAMPTSPLVIPEWMMSTGPIPPSFSPAFGASIAAVDAPVGESDAAAMRVRDPSSSSALAAGAAAEATGAPIPAPLMPATPWFDPEEARRSGLWHVSSRLLREGRASATLRIMHPLPRDRELNPDVRSAIVSRSASSPLTAMPLTLLFPSSVLATPDRWTATRVRHTSDRCVWA